MSAIVHLEIPGTIDLFRYDGSHHPSRTHDPGPPVLTHAAARPGRSRWVHGPNPYVGTEAAGGIRSHWLFLEGTCLGAGRTWVEAQGCRLPDTAAAMTPARPTHGPRPATQSARLGKGGRP